MHHRLGALRPFAFAASFVTLALFAFLPTGCLITATAEEVPGRSDPTLTDRPVTQVSIDTGAALTADPGQGVGVFVEYEEGGHWRVFTTCDTEKSSAACSFDMLASTSSSDGFSAVGSQSLADDDTLEVQSDGSIHLVTQTSLQSNGMSFDAAPGAVVELDMLLDGVPQPSLVFAVSSGKLLEGVPSNPVAFAPTSD